MKYLLLLPLAALLLLSGCVQQNKTIEERVQDCGNDSSCLTIIALENNNAQVCMEISYAIDRNDCLEQMAIKYKNAGYCDLMEFDFDRANCLAKVDTSPQ